MVDKQYFNEVVPEWDHLRESFFCGSGERQGDISCDGAIRKNDRRHWSGDRIIAGGLIERGLNVLAIDQSIAMMHVDILQPAAKHL